jgi:[ribosomal protein S5]-alanine N-acetyltransferase
MLPTTPHIGPQMPNVEVRQLPAEALYALARGNVSEAAQFTGFELPTIMVAPDWLDTWRRRSHQVREMPHHLGWVTGVVVDTDTAQIVGKAGFHEPPNAQGVVEVGYQIDPSCQGRGYATAALAWLLNRAQDEPMVRAVRACVAPDNLPSLHIVSGAGFVRVGEEWDEEDSRIEWVYLLEFEPRDTT